MVLKDLSKILPPTSLFLTTKVQISRASNRGAYQPSQTPTPVLLTCKLLNSSELWKAGEQFCHPDSTFGPIWILLLGLKVVEKTRDQTFRRQNKKVRLQLQAQSERKARWLAPVWPSVRPRELWKGHSPPKSCLLAFWSQSPSISKPLLILKLRNLTKNNNRVSQLDNTTIALQDPFYKQKTAQEDFSRLLSREICSNRDHRRPYWGKKNMMSSECNSRTRNHLCSIRRNS